MNLEFAEVLENSIRAMIEGVHTIVPGRVVSYDGHDKRTATVQPVVRLPTSSGPLIDIPPIAGVPVAFPSSAAGSLLFPLSKGDGVLILVAEVGIGKFMTSKAGAVSDPDDHSRHTFTDAIAIPGLWSIPTVPETPAGLDAANGTVLYSKSGSVVELGKTLGLRNETSDLKKEIQGLWTVIEDLYQRLTDMSTGKLIAGTYPVAPVPAAATWWAELVTKKTAAGTSKTNVGKLLT